MDIDWRELERVVLERNCPICGSNTVVEVEYEADDEIWFECQDCGWDKTFKLSDAKEAGY